MIGFFESRQGGAMARTSARDRSAVRAATRKTSAPRATESTLASGTEEFCRDREFSIATNFIVFSIATGKSLSRQTSQGLL